MNPSITFASKYLPVIFTLLLLGSCDSSNNSKIEKIVPLYQSCLQYFDEYKKIAKDRYEVELAIKRFSVKHGYNAHPSLIGIVEVSTANNLESLEVIENGLELLCFPKHSVTTDADALGLRIVKETLSQHFEQGKTENYIVMSKEKISVHFNNTTEEMKAGIIKP